MLYAVESSLNPVQVLFRQTLPPDFTLWFHNKNIYFTLFSVKAILDIKQICEKKSFFILCNLLKH
jgi:hypothetical protein